MTYREFVVKSTSNLEGKDRLTLIALGLAGESGEVADIIKTIAWQGRSLDRDHLIEELGDVRWYLELMAAELGISMEEIEAINQEKLTKRYAHLFQGSVE
jgi:NTP pyrophosphatase (non-canonical NTP hydrolase)